MIISSLKVRGYRGFSKEQHLAFGMPNGAPGSGLTVLVGPNNGGKSSLVEVLSYLRDPAGSFVMHEGQRNSAAGRKVSCEYVLDSATGKWTVTSSGELRWDWPKTRPSHGHVFVVPSRRSIPNTFSPRVMGREEYARAVPDVGARQHGGTNFPIRLSGIDPDTDDFMISLRMVFEGAPDWHVERMQGGTSFMKIAAPSGSHSSEGLGDGLASGVQVVDALFDAPKNCIVVVDEPEMSLHPAACRRLAEMFAEASRERQIVISTHSPFLAPLEWLASGARVARVASYGNSCEIHQLKPETGRRLASLANDLNNPHVLGIEAREVLFLADRILLVEGQEDVVGYQRAFEAVGETPSGSFFGWGAGGADKFDLVLTALSELGFRRVAGIVDATHATQAKELSKRFPEYRIFAIPTDDIRDKPHKGITGLCTTSLRLKEEYTGTVRALVAGLNSYLSS